MLVAASDILLCYSRVIVSGFTMYTMLHGTPCMIPEKKSFYSGFPVSETLMDRESRTENLYFKTFFEYRRKFGPDQTKLLKPKNIQLILFLKSS